MIYIFRLIGAFTKSNLGERHKNKYIGDLLGIRRSADWKEGYSQPDLGTGQRGNEYSWREGC